MGAISITAASVLASTSSRRTEYIAAEAIAAGQAVYITTSGTAGLCDADFSAGAKANCVGIACDSAPAAGQSVIVATYDTQFTLGGTIAAGVPVFSSATAGGITSTAADNSSGVFTCFLGIGIGSNKIWLQPVYAATSV